MFDSNLTLVRLGDRLRPGQVVSEMIGFKAADIGSPQFQNRPIVRSKVEAESEPEFSYERITITVNK
jgi:hypothetical protein